MKRETLALAGFAAMPFLACTANIFAQVITPLEPWARVANRNDVIPGTEQPFTFFSEPSVNRLGAVVFRGANGQTSSHPLAPVNPLAGVYLRLMGSADQPVQMLFQRGTEVPAPNNVENPPLSGHLAGFREFPGFPRIDADALMATARGSSGAVWRFYLPDGEEVREGTSGVFATSNGSRYTVCNMLGDAFDPDTLDMTFPQFGVPNEHEGTAFTGFPGTSTVGDSRYVAFKATWSGGWGMAMPPDHRQTGLFVRDLAGQEDVLREVISTEMDIPGSTLAKSQPRVEYIGAPSACDNNLVFLALDDYERPSHGGIYRTTFFTNPGVANGSSSTPTDLVPVVRLGDAVPGVDHPEQFEELGEAISINGRWIAFWGAWNHDNHEVRFDCPSEEEDPELAKYCQHEENLALHHDGFEVHVRDHQGIFVYDIETGTTVLVAQTGNHDGDIDSFVTWEFSGTVPNDGHDDHLGGGNNHDDGIPTDQSERARWRMKTFAAIETATSFGSDESHFRIAFKGFIHNHFDKTFMPPRPIESIFMAEGPVGDAPVVIVSTGDLGSTLDPDAPEGSTIRALGMEREALRDGWFVISAKMRNHDTDESWAGVYSSGSATNTSDFNRDGLSDIFWHSEEFDLASFWAMHGLEWNEGGYTTIAPDADWVAQFTADLDGDNAPDIIWRNPNTGVFYAWLMRGGEVLASQAISGAVELEWKIIAVGDMNADDRDDIVLQNQTTGEVRGWLMDGFTKLAGGFIGDSSGLTFVGMGDLDADRHDDLLWQRPDGTVLGWRMLGLTLVETGDIANAHAVDPNWKPVGVADLNGDLREDIIWQDKDNGWVAAWLMDGLTRADGAYIALDMGPGFSLIAARDLDGDGHADMVWRDDASGDVSGWLMNGFDITSSAFIRSVETYWRAVP